MIKVNTPDRCHCAYTSTKSYGIIYHIMAYDATKCRYLYQRDEVSNSFLLITILTACIWSPYTPDVTRLDNSYRPNDYFHKSL